MGMRIERAAAEIAALFVNTNRDRAKYPQPFPVEDFMPHADEVELDLVTAMKQWS